MRTKIRGEEYRFCCRGDSLLVVDGNNVRFEKIWKTWGLKFWTSLTLGVSILKRERWEIWEDCDVWERGDKI